jgi:hypothetical protein
VTIVNGNLTFGVITEASWYYIETYAVLDLYPFSLVESSFLYFDVLDSCLYTQIYPLKVSFSESKYEVLEIDYEDVDSINTKWFTTDGDDLH